MDDRRHPMARVRGLGSAKEGVQHWWAQRMTAIALVPLMLWFVAMVAATAGAGHADAEVFIGSPVNAVLLILLLGTAFYHGQLGLQVVIEDYIHTGWLRLAALIVVKFGAALLGVATIMAVLRIALAS